MFRVKNVHTPISNSIRAPDRMFFISICIDRSNIQYTVMWHLQKSAHKILRVFLCSLIHFYHLAVQCTFQEKKNPKIPQGN